MKKVISLFLSVCVVCAYTIPTFAVEEANLANSEENTELARETIFIEANSFGLQTEAIANDLDNLKSVGIPETAISIHGVKKDLKKGNRVVYDFQVTEDIVNQVTVKEELSGNLELTFVEGLKKDVLVYTPDEKLLLNGNEITFSSTKSVNSNDVKMTPFAYTTVYGKTPFSGKRADYNIFIDDYTESKISLGGAFLASCVTGTVATVICNFFKLALAANIYATLVSSAAAALIAMAKENPTYNNGWISSLVNKMGKKGNVSYNSYYLYKTGFYTGANLTGGMTYHEYYSYRFFN